MNLMFKAGECPRCGKEVLYSAMLGYFCECQTGASSVFSEEEKNEIYHKNKGLLKIQ